MCAIIVAKCPSYETHVCAIGQMVAEIHHHETL